MATELNRRLLDEADLLPAEVKRAGPAGPRHRGPARRASAAADAALAAGRGVPRRAPRRTTAPSTARAAPLDRQRRARRLPGANVAAGLGARRPCGGRGPPGALARASTCSCSATASRSPTRSRSEARGPAARGLLVMGPECGTSLSQRRQALGFANRVRQRTRSGWSAASGTGPPGGDDADPSRLGRGSLAGASERAGAISTQRSAGSRRCRCSALARARSRDARDRARLEGAVARTSPRARAGGGRRDGKPVVAYLPGWSGTPPASVVSVPTLEATALAARPGARAEAPAFAGRRAGRVARHAPAGGVLGLFTGGTLCEEARRHRRRRRRRVRRLRRPRVHARAAASDHRSEPPAAAAVARAGGDRGRRRGAARPDPRRLALIRIRPPRSPVAIGEAAGSRARARARDARGRRPRGRHRRGSSGSRRPGRKLRRKRGVRRLPRRTAWPAELGPRISRGARRWRADGRAASVRSCASSTAGRPLRGRARGAQGVAVSRVDWRPPPPATARPRSGATRSDAANREAPSDRLAGRPAGPGRRPPGHRGRSGHDRHDRCFTLDRRSRGRA